MAAIAVCFTDMPSGARLVIFALIISSLLFYLARDVFRIFPGSWLKLVFERGEVKVLTRTGASFYGKVEKSTVVLPYLIALHIKVEGSSRRIYRVLFPDALESGEFRDLCIRLKFS